jgi:glycosidase
MRKNFKSLKSISASVVLSLAIVFSTSFTGNGMAAHAYSNGVVSPYSNSTSADSSDSPVTSKDVIYQILTDRFYDGDTSNNIPSGFDSSLFDGTGQKYRLYQGGDWQGIIDKIPYLKSMGITAVWISAPYENRDTEIDDYNSDGSISKWTSYHGYHVRNYFATNKHFGTFKQFESLRDALHQNGMKLIIDFVTNHTSRSHNPTLNNANEDGKLYEPDKKSDGSYALDVNGEPYDYNGDGKVENLLADPNNDINGWFHQFGDRGNDNSVWGYRNKDLGSLADFSQENPSVVSYLESAVKYWNQLGINGLRYDATLHENPAFVKGLMDAVNKQSTVTQFGEFFIGRPSDKYSEYCSFPSRTGVNNLDFEYYRANSTCFGDFSTTMSDFANMMQYTQKDYQFSNQAVTFIDNQDVPRFGYQQQNQKPFNASLAVLLTARGIPNIYYGTEQYVNPGTNDNSIGRIFMEKQSSFNENTTAYKLIKKLSDLRQSNDAIAYGQTSVLYSDNNVMVFQRKFYDNTVVVAVNRQPDQAYTVPSISVGLPSGTYSDYLGSMLYGDSTTVSNGKIDSIGLSGGEVDVWSYNAAAAETPEVGDIMSTQGSAGTKVYIYGRNFGTSPTVKFGNISATVLSSTSTMIETTVPSGAVHGYNSVTVANNGVISKGIIYNVLSGDQNQVIFHVKASTNSGDNIYVVGSIPELGSWDTNKCTEAMLCPNYPEWYLPVSVPANTTFQFKFIKKDSSGNVTWESASNRTVTSSTSTTGVVDTPVYTWSAN